MAETLKLIFLPAFMPKVLVYNKDCMISFIRDLKIPHKCCIFLGPLMVSKPSLY